MSPAQFKALPKTVQWLITILSLGVIGLMFAFIFHDTRILAFVGIGVAAAIAPTLGVVLPLWAMETDVNDRPDIPKGPAHH
jgi:hypothetical protein